jgi:flagellar assembly protein FliH
MSEKIKITGRASKIAVTIKDTAGSNFHSEDSTENFIQKQLDQYYQQGLVEGKRIEREELEEIYSQRLIEKYAELNGIMAKLDEKILLYEKEFENLVVNLSFILAESITRKEIERETNITATLKDAVKKILGANNVIVKLHPEDHQEIIKNNDAILMDDSFARIKFESDERIDRGGCFVETEIGNVDARIPTQLNELKRQFDSYLTIVQAQ